MNTENARKILDRHDKELRMFVPNADEAHPNDEQVQNIAAQEAPQLRKAALVPNSAARLAKILQDVLICRIILIQ